MNLKTFGLSAVVVIALSVPASGHHSLAAYDTDTEISVTATVTEFEWANPHCWLHIMVEGEDGTARLWTLESNSVGQMIRAGWTADSVKAGDEVTIDLNPLRDGTRGGRLNTVHFSDGRVLRRQGGGGAYDPRTGVLLGQ